MERSVSREVIENAPRNLVELEVLMAERDRYREALEAIANAEIPGVSGGPHGASAEVMEFARRALEDSTDA